MNASALTTVGHWSLVPGFGPVPLRYPRRLAWPLGKDADRVRAMLAEAKGRALSSKPAGLERKTP